MNHTTYTPHPMDTSDVVLPEELNALAELIAENVHEVYAAGRIAEGWTWGPERNDTLRQNPTLVPYSQLSEIEKDFDRNTAFSTLRLITKLGFKITKQ